MAQSALRLGRPEKPLASDRITRQPKPNVELAARQTLARERVSGQTHGSRRTARSKAHAVQREIGLWPQKAGGPHCPGRLRAVVTQLPGRGRAQRATAGVAAVTLVTCLACMGGLFMSTGTGSQQGRVSTAALAAGKEGSPADVAVHSQPALQRQLHGTVQLTALAPLAAVSPLGRGGVSWAEVLQHTAQKMAWANSSYSLAVHDASATAAEAVAALEASLGASQIAVVIGVQDDDPAAAALLPLLARVPTVVALGCGPQLRQAATRLGGRAPLASKSLLQRLFDLLPWSAARHDAEVLASVEELFGRQSSEDLLFSMLVLINQHVAEVPLVSNSAKSKNAGLDTLQCMVGKCGAEIFQCFADTSCRTALNCLNDCKFNDQVCSYRCIASYESPQLASFSLCILQKHNCLGLTAEAPMVPDPAPMTSFRGQPLTHELAEDMFVGWLGGASAKSQALPGNVAGTEAFSWRAFSGKNPAYDAFPCQYQLFYRGLAKNSMWYDPVFKVKTVDGREVWRSRHYRVRRAQQPGTFRLSVLDNGVTSDEYWRVLDCKEDLEWCAFYYSGAAKAAGASYGGAILASRSGAWPESQADLRRIEAALDRAGIKLWELSDVDNTDCVDAPLVAEAAFG